MTGVAFGIFDSLERTDAPLGTLYENRLRLAEQADAAGFRTYHVAEHHATRLGMAPSPGVYLGAVAQRTRRLRFGPLVYVLPLYNPLRLIEEICMLDQMSGGRFELGVGRGASPYELAYCGVAFHESREMFEEALEVIRAGLQGGRLRHRGRHYRYDGVPLELACVQKPHPPLWQGIASRDSAAETAKQGVNVVMSAPIASVKALAESYFEACDGAAGGSPLVGCSRFVFVGESDAEALAIARPAYQAWYESVTSLWRAFGAVPHRFAPSLERALAGDTAIVGAPATVRAEVERHLAETGCNYFVGRFAFGDLAHEHAARSMALFASEVMPKLAAS
ncbi:MAG: LLM class flavin-dependent oxidoreductase [Candidatus Rokubacteria bacterium]|nr:LLM class flavin-dependent oxidoreductase [Candidatus Rokubacteria bacterium]